MTYYVNDLTLSNIHVTRRRSNDRWTIFKKPSITKPYVEQVGQSTSDIAFDIDFVGTGRYDMYTSLKAEITYCERILIDTLPSGDYIHGNKRFVWIAQDSLTINEQEGPILSVTLAGLIDPYQIVTCDFLRRWGNSAGVTLSEDSAFYGKYSIKSNVASPVSSSTYYAEFTLPAETDFSDANYISLWLRSNRASTAYTWSRFYLIDDSSNYYYWNTSTYPADKWTHSDLDITSYSGQVGSPDITAITKVRVAIKAADTTPFYIMIDNIRMH